MVGKDCTIPGHPEILVTGDVMSLDKLPGVAEVAMQTGLYAGRKIGHQAQGRAFDKPFRYRDLGSAAYISRGNAVVSAFGLHFGGFLGWWVWLFIHIGFLTGYRNRVGAVLGWWFAFTRDLRRERTFTIDDMPVAAGRTASTRPLRRIRPRPEGALSAEAARADDDQQDHVQQQLQRRTSCFAPAAEGDGQADVGGRGNGGHGNEDQVSDAGEVREPVEQPPGETRRGDDADVQH